MNLLLPDFYVHTISYLRIVCILLGRSGRLLHMGKLLSSELVASFVEGFVALRTRLVNKYVEQAYRRSFMNQTELNPLLQTLVTKFSIIGILLRWFCDDF